MSWSFEHKGQHAAVKAKILAEPYVPSTLKQALCEIVGNSEGGYNGVSVKSAGHVESDGRGTVYDLKVDQIVLALNPVTVTVAPAPATEVAAPAPTEPTPGS